MSEAINHHRRRLGTAAMTTAAVEFVMIGYADAQSRKTKRVREKNLYQPFMRTILSFLLPGVCAGHGFASAASEPPAFKVERWVNSTQLTAEALRGKVVLVDVWEYTCVNWIRTSPYVKAWNRDYAGLGLVVIGVHAPEFEFGKRAEHIDRGIRDHGLSYPIALDNDFATWRAFGNDAWPPKYLFDARGTLVKRWIGEGSYGDIETETRRLLVAASPGTTLPP